jgi:hypothetical protein
LTTSATRNVAHAQGEWMNPLMKDIAALAESVSGLARRAVAE